MSVSVASRFIKLLAVGLVVLLTACGGGSGGGGDDVVTPTPEPPPEPHVNEAPVVANANGRLRAVHLHSFSYDATQGGRTFSDPDGDPLTYEVTLSPPGAMPGLRVEGTTIVGVPEEVGFVEASITATDPDGRGVGDQFSIVVDPNGPPSIASANDDVLLAAGSSVVYDATKAGNAFMDPDGDALTYQVSLRGASPGLSVDGTRVVGKLDTVGLVEVTVSARDAYGGSASDVFLVAVPAPEPGVPALPATPYRYDDAALDLPFVFRISSETQTPLWDTQPEDNRTTDAGAALGRVLFYDKRLSITNTVACATCHVQSHGFSSPDRFSVGALGVPTKRHVMALANVRYNIQHAWFSDMRVESLQELVVMPIENSEELGNSMDRVASRLPATAFYPPLFEAAFGTSDVTPDRVARALAQFLQALISYRTKFDLAYNPMFNGPGDPASVLTEQEFRGAEIFGVQTEGISPPGICVSCHKRIAQTNEWQANNGLDAVPSDPGALDEAIRRDGSIGVFRAASLRNIAVTAPYMHDGRFATLREVIDHYDHGIQDSPNLDLFLRDLNSGAPMRLNLTEEDKQALEAFLRTLTDDEFLTDPKFSDPFAPLPPE